MSLEKALVDVRGLAAAHTITQVRGNAGAGKGTSGVGAPGSSGDIAVGNPESTLVNVLARDTIPRVSGAAGT